MLLLLVACSHAPGASVRPEPAARIQEEPEIVVVDAGLAPIAGEWLETLGEVKVSVPLGATSARPLIVAAHGAGDRPEWACSGWRGVTDAYAFIACPHGSPFGDAYAWSSLEQIEQRILDAEQVARARWPSYIDPGPIILVGFSQGARLVSVLARKHPDRWSSVVLLEGGYDETAWAFGPAFAKGGKRIVLACSTWHCAEGFEGGAKSLRDAHVDSRLVDLGNLGHHMGPTVTNGMHEPWRWLVRDDPRWEKNQPSL